MYNERDSGMTGYTITKELHSQLELNRIKWAKHYKRRNTYYYDEYQLDRPDIYMLGGLDISIFELIPLKRAFDKGCGTMSRIEDKDFCKGLVQLKYQFLGLARVGEFDVNCASFRGEGLETLASKSPNAVMLSLGRNGMMLERLTEDSWRMDKLSIEVVG